MGYTLPTFIVPVKIWRDPSLSLPIPPTTPADITTVGNLCPGRRTQNSTDGEGSDMYVLLPPAVVVYDGSPGPTWGMDILEIPASSGRYYRCYYADNVATGFSNQHVICVLQKASPYGSGSGSAPPPAPPPTLTPIALGGSTTSIAGSNTLSHTFSAPYSGNCVFAIVVYNGNEAPIIPGYGMDALVTTTQGANTAILYMFQGTATAGANTITATLYGSAIRIMQCRAILSPAYIDGRVIFNANATGTGDPQTLSTGGPHTISTSMWTGAIVVWSTNGTSVVDGDFTQYNSPTLIAVGGYSPLLITAAKAVLGTGPYLLRCFNGNNLAWGAAMVRTLH